MNHKVLICVFVLEVIFFSGNGMARGETNNVDIISSLLTVYETSAFEKMQALSAIREGKPSVAAELLEFDIDRLVVKLWRHQKSCRESQRTQIVAFLGMVLAYRNTYERDKNVKIGDASVERIKMRYVSEAEEILRSLDGGTVRSGEPVKKTEEDKASVERRELSSKSYEELEFLSERAFRLKDRWLAEQSIRAIMKLIPDPSDARYQKAEHHLKELQQPAADQGQAEVSKNPSVKKKALGSGLKIRFR